MAKISILPLDDRPVNYDYPRLLAVIAEVNVESPPREWLGNPWRGAQHEKLIAWLRESAATADALIVAVDTLAYGGLIPSRSSSNPFDVTARRLEVLREIKSIYPNIIINASSVIQRVSRANSAEEERPARLKAQLEFLFMRLLDDFCYQALERSLCMLEDLPALGLLPMEERLPNAEVAKTVSEKVTGRLQDQAHILEKIFCADNTVKSVSTSRKVYRYPKDPRKQGAGVRPHPVFGLIEVIS